MVAHYHIIFEPFIRVFDFDHDNWQLDCMMIIVFSYCFYHSCLCMCFDFSVSKVFLISIFHELFGFNRMNWKMRIFVFSLILSLVEYSGYWFSAICFVPKGFGSFYSIFCFEMGLMLFCLFIDYFNFVFSISFMTLFLLMCHLLFYAKVDCFVLSTCSMIFLDELFYPVHVFYLVT